MIQPTGESRGVWWSVLVAAWLFCAAIVALHTAAVRDYVATLNGIGEIARGEGATPLRQVLPARHADAQTWVRHVLEAEEAGVARLRRTSIDNARQGREVHWSSAFASLVRLAGKLQHRVTADGWPASLERSLWWFNAPLLLAVVIALSWWAARRLGSVAGAFVAVALVGHNRFYEGFAPAYVDHHGLAVAAVLGLVLGVAFMGAGWWRRADGAGRPGVLPRSREEARSAATVSAVCGALGLWLSAAAVLPAIALCGLGGLVVARGGGKRARDDGAIFDADVWRRWGRVGGTLSFACYLLEYAPGHLGWRLEVNHPLYALAWWGGAEIVAIVADWFLADARGRPRLGARLLLPSLALAAPPAALLVGGTDVFLVADPFVGAMRHFVAEGRTLAATIGQRGWLAVSYDLISALVLLPAAWQLRRSAPAERVVLGTLLIVTAGLVALAVGEIRWWVTASGPQIALALMVVVTVTRRSAAGARWMVWGTVAVALFAVPAGYRVARERMENRSGAVAQGDLFQPLYRELAATIRASQPSGEIVLLADPNASAGIGYFGRYKSLGTLYWENVPGLRAAAEIYSARSDDAALALVRARGVSHVVTIDAANFVGEYFRLLHPHASEAEMRQTFGARLMAGAESVPRWLQPIPYRRSAELAVVGGRVRVFKIAPDQTEAEWLYHTAVAQIAADEIAAAEKTFERALAGVPAAARVSFHETAGAAFYDYGADAAAVRMFRRALALGYEASLANTTAWILATSRDASLRDGRAALQLAEPLAQRAGDDPTVLSTYAAALAEMGRWAEAVRAAERAVGLIRGANDAAATRLLEKRLESYRAGRPWRQ